MARADVPLLYFIKVVGIWSLTPYQKCAIRCQYCIAKAQGEALPCCEAENVVAALREELPRVPLEVELFIGSMADAYPPVEAELGLTRLVLQELVAQKRPFCIGTKSDLVCRDLDILTAYDGHCDVGISLCTTNEAAVSTMEPAAPTVAQRLRALARLQAAGIETFLSVAPWIPGVTDTATLIASVPAGTDIQLSPLDVRQSGGRLRLLGRDYTQDEVNAAYALERERFGEIDGVTWKDPLVW
ncbi:MAG: SPL family radical SAM protein [Armatimonadota bacterium]